jgi:hypothetical protein
MTARPTTSRGAFDTSSLSASDRDPQYTYSQEYSVADEQVESEEEDVFAFLPPSSAGPTPLPPHSESPWPPPSLEQTFSQHYVPADIPSPTSPPPPFSPAVDPLVYPPPAFISQRSTPHTIDSPPPSTGDHSFSTEDGFRLRRLEGLPTVISATADFSFAASQIPKSRFTLDEKHRVSDTLSDSSSFDPELDGVDSVSIK